MSDNMLENSFKLGNILKVFGDQLNTFICHELGSTEQQNHVLLENPATDIDAFTSGDGVYLSLFNIEEELTLREGYVSQRVENDSVHNSQPSVNINLQVIFIAHYAKDYVTELNTIHTVLAFFQNKPVFNLTNTPELANCGLSADDKLKFELNTLPLKDLHYIWGNLGVKQRPCISYKIKMLRIQNDTLATTGVIKRIELRNKG